MADNDLNTDQAVTDQDLNTADVVNQPDLTDQPVQDQNQDDVLADGTTKDKQVPYSELEKATKRAKEAEEATAYAQRTIDLMNANAQQQQVQPAAPKTVSEQALASLGITEEDLYEPKNIIKYQEAVTKISNAQTQQNNAAVQTQQFMIATPDLSQVVGSVNPMTGQIIAGTSELLALVAKKPYLQQASTQDLYQAVMDERQFVEVTKTASTQKEFQTRAGVKTATQPLGGSAAGGGGAGTQGKQQLLSRDQVTETLRKLAAGEIIS